jgi:hypothetical protein
MPVLEMYQLSLEREEIAHLKVAIVHTTRVYLGLVHDQQIWSLIQLGYEFLLIFGIALNE